MRKAFVGSVLCTFRLSNEVIWTQASPDIRDTHHPYIMHNNIISHEMLEFVKMNYKCVRIDTRHELFSINLFQLNLIIDWIIIFKSSNLVLYFQCLIIYFVF